MTAVSVNISGECLANSKSLLNIVVPNSLNYSKSDAHILTAISGLPANDSTRVVSDCLATIKGSPRILFVPISSLVFHKMPNSRTNLTAAAQGASTSTVNARNSATSKSGWDKYLTKGSYLNLKSKLNKAERELSELRAPRHVYRVRLVSYFHYSDGTKNTYELDKEYEASSRAEAIGMATIEMGHIEPSYSIAPVCFGGTKICTLVK